MTAPTPSTEPLAPAIVAASPVPLDETAQARLARYRDLLLEWNSKFNLTAITDPAEVERKLFLDALRMAPALAEAADAWAASHPNGGVPRLIDVGTGAGFPGLPLKIALPHLDVTLLDATNKKVTFLQAVIADLSLAGIAARHGRAEELGHDPAFRGHYALATARAVSSLPALIELVTPFLAVGGRAFFPKGAAIDQELTEGKRAASLLRARIISSELLPHAPGDQVTKLVIVDRLEATPPRFPRRAGLPSREPLGRATSP